MMVLIPQNTSVQDGQAFKDMEKEVSGMFEERVFIKRWQSAAGGSPKDGVRQTDSYLQIKAKANITEVSAREVAAADSVIRLGDLKAEFRIEIFGGESYSGDGQTSGRKPDSVVYHGREYQIVGQVFKNHLVSKTHWSCMLRQVK